MPITTQHFQTIPLKNNEIQQNIVDLINANFLNWVSFSENRKKVEKERIAFRKAIHNDNLHEELFDFTINRASFSNDDIVDIIELMMDKKGIPDF